MGPHCNDWAALLLVSIRRFGDVLTDKPALALEELTAQEGSGVRADPGSLL